MMNHKLRMLVLKHLSQGPRAGYRLIKEIEEATGWRPSYGSVYPLLSTLLKEGLVTAREEGKRKIYSLTKRGKDSFAEFERQHDRMIATLQETHKVMSHLCNVDHDPLFEQFISRFGHGTVPFKDVLKPGFRLRAELARIARQGLLDTRKKEVVAILEEATHRLKGIKAARPGRD